MQHARLESSGSTVRSWRPLIWTMSLRLPETTLPPRLVVTWFTCYKSPFQTSASMLVSSEGWVALTQSPCWASTLIRRHIASLALYRSFSLRGWLENSPESNAWDEYVDSLECLRNNYSGLKDTPEVFTEMVAYLMEMPELKMRKHLCYIFHLSCLCLTSKLLEFPAIKLPGVDCSDPRSRLFDVIMPAQSYLANVANSLAACTT